MLRKNFLLSETDVACTNWHHPRTEACFVGTLLSCLYAKTADPRRASQRDVRPAYVPESHPPCTSPDHQWTSMQVCHSPYQPHISSCNTTKPIAPSFTWDIFKLPPVFQDLEPLFTAELCLVKKKQTHNDTVQYHVRPCSQAPAVHPSFYLINFPRNFGSWKAIMSSRVSTHQTEFLRLWLWRKKMGRFVCASAYAHPTSLW